MYMGMHNGHVYAYISICVQALCLKMKMSMLEYSCFDYIVSHVNISWKKKFWGENCLTIPFVSLLQPTVQQHYKKPLEWIMRYVAA